MNNELFIKYINCIENIEKKSINFYDIKWNIGYLETYIIYNNNKHVFSSKKYEIISLLCNDIKYYRGLKELLTKNISICSINGPNVIINTFFRKKVCQKSKCIISLIFKILRLKKIHIYRSNYYYKTYNYFYIKNKYLIYIKFIDKSKMSNTALRPISNIYKYNVYKNLYILY